MRVYDHTMPGDLPIPEGALAIWVIYDHPRDHPDKFVLRPQFSMSGGLIAVSPLAWTADNIEELRYELVNMGLTMMQRHPGDDPKIVETWL